MPAPRNRPHIIVESSPSVEAYKPHGRAIIPKKPFVPPDRVVHGLNLKHAIEVAEADEHERRTNLQIHVEGAIPGVYVLFESHPGEPLNLASLESAQQGIELRSVVAVPTQGPNGELLVVERATVFVPDGQVKHFISRFEQYAQDTPRQKGERRYEKMIDPVATLRLATLRALWTDVDSLYPIEDTSIWWEVWLRRNSGQELDRFLAFSSLAGMQVAPRRLAFDDRVVVIVRGTSAELSNSLDVLNDIAEVRKAKESPAAFLDMGPTAQATLADSIVSRTIGPEQDAPAVCVLDTGVNRGHPLLESLISPEDCLACDATWGTFDHDGHGTNMAGLALYGDLTDILASVELIRIRSAVESVKILPPPPEQNDPNLYGAITAEAASRVEIQAPDRRRIFSMSITADQRDRGQPTSWSAAVDALAAGRAFDPTDQGLTYIDDGHDPRRRLFVISAGNLAPPELDHLSRSDIEPIHDPGQAWNALTVGAMTDKVDIREPDFMGWNALAPQGELSPYSTTSVAFSGAWPIKPDVVFEGGNVGVDTDENLEIGIADLNVITTYRVPATRLFDLCRATSAATAQVARLAAHVSADYPNFTPETIRGLVVHAAEWTPAMRARMEGAATKAARLALARRYGFGVPSIERALRSANDALTLIVQGTIHPFDDGKLREIHFYELPWPTEVLAELGATRVQLRVTLSYFIDPNPARRGWRQRYSYASHSLRFDVKGPTETIDDFRKRLNKQALDEGEKKPSATGDSANWFLGEQGRNHGSIHSDLLDGTAADLAARGVIGVYPIGGWWKEQPKRDHSEQGAPYSLLVSIQTEATDVDIWTPVATMVGVPVTITPIEI